MRNSYPFIIEVRPRVSVRVIREDIVALDAPRNRREGDVVAVERGTPLAVHRAVGREVRFRRLLATLESFDATLDGFDGPPNPLLDEVGGQVGFLAERVVHRSLGFRFRGNVVPAVAVPAPVTRAVGAVFEPLDGLSEC